MSDRVPPRALTHRTHLVDTLLAGEAGMVGVFTHELADGSVLLIEAGSGATTDTVIQGLSDLGIQASDVRALVVTHVHLDHAAGAGHLAAWSDAPVYVHPLGVRHLANPTRLWNSAERIYGDAMQRLWGRMDPIPEDRLRPLEDRRPLELGGSRFDVVHTPGHARHHLTLIDSEGSAYAGDVAGILLEDVPIIRPALPPPDIDLELAAASCRALAQHAPDRLLLTHYGAVEGQDAVQRHLATVPERNQAWADEVQRGIEAGEDHDTLVARVKQLEQAELDAANVQGDPRHRYTAMSNADMTVMGLVRHHAKHVAVDADGGG